MMSLKEIVSLLPVCEVSGFEEKTIIETISMDSRLIEKKSLFFCVPGFTVDGHDFAQEAVEAGAAALVTDRPIQMSVPVIQVPDVRRAMALISARFYEYPSQELKMIGVTGTNGKTSVTHFLEQMLELLEVETGIIGTMYTKYAGKEISSNNTTPESIVLQKILRDMRDAETEAAAMEVSSHALSNGRIHGTRFDIAVYTNLSQDHLDYHATMEDYARAKSLLFAQLGSGFVKERQPYSVINVDDPYSEIMMEASAAPLITYGLSKHAAVRAEEVELSGGRSNFYFCAPGIRDHVTLNLPGRFSIYNALAAASALYAYGWRWQEIIPLIPLLKGVRGRFEPVFSSAPVHALVDYAHTPDSLENVLQTIKDAAEGKIITVIGCGGDRDRKKRPLMAAIAEKYSSFTYLTSDNPRTEKPEAIIEEMKSGMSGIRYNVIVDREEAINEAVRKAKPGDVVLIAGKGHETYQEIGRDRIYFDDKKAAEKALKEWVE
ncbi:UDP-N-acetylmuramoyl-L-alanyl-D-glutamate--2,6-diaminopimelate ligase [Alkalicoccus halolimnae]|uniref:UDP-N-acetylmuramoyl-L-alanyl-D-glutamate--2,6-diaminopimelate ligase n=1 Tax=Alkalicoccus halolimnae TaxID=1667239 RepID=A0A5C7FBC6_9BACI|nr:UDP-N-acetylmuramoyl-L-alanyl-D-glutamate--2,6-diaminopimelate ligase [Alkalicoccus halolimnae]TXF87433.1 UDP-N-acetylmuramoyl-L-alanyl-D-glutamate--2,6-diaminopimelate ligase [Alkalicoccus halolimnae]